MIEDKAAIAEIDGLLMKIVTHDKPKLNDYEWTVVTQALEYLKESYAEII